MAALEDRYVGHELNDDALAGVSGGVWSPSTSTVGNLIAAFPDVCKAPSPGGPVPLPYPNLGTTDPTRG
ncbi:MAG: hypothetical protein AB7U83_01000 [Vicinamibacterales bacterium]